MAFLDFRNFLVISNDFLGLATTEARASSTFSGVQAVLKCPERPFLFTKTDPVASNLSTIRLIAR